MPRTPQTSPAGVRSRRRSARSAASAATPRPTSASCSQRGSWSRSRWGASRRASRPRCPAPAGRPPARSRCRREQLIDRNFHGLSSYGLMTVDQLAHEDRRATARSGRSIAGVERTLRADRAVSSRASRRPPGVSISRDGHTAIVQAGAARDSNAMVQAADRLKGRLAALSSGGVQVNLTGAPGDVVRLQRREPLRDAQVRGDLVAGDALILLVAFGSLVAAGLPLDADDGRSDGGRRLAVPRHQRACRSRSGR